MMHAPLFANRVDRNDVRMVQGGRSTGLVAEPLQRCCLHQRGKGQHLQRDPPADRQLLRFVDGPHAAATQLADQAKVAKLVLGEHTHLTASGDSHGRVDDAASAVVSLQQAFRLPQQFHIVAARPTQVRLALVRRVDLNRGAENRVHSWFFAHRSTPDDSFQ